MSSGVTVRAWLRPAVAVGAILALADVVTRQPRWLTWPAARALGAVVVQVPTRRRAIALTFDDGPHEDVTPSLLDVLARHGATATFFVMGGRVPGREAVIDRLAAEGHELGNHLMDAAPTMRQTPEVFVRDLLACDRMLSSWADVRYFRPASGWIRPRMLTAAAALGYRCALGSVTLIRDPVRHPVLAAHLLLLRVRPGAVIVLHEGTATRAAVVACVDRFLAHLRRRGYEAVSLAELESASGADPSARPARRVSRGPRRAR